MPEVKNDRLRRGHDLQISCKVGNNDFGDFVSHISVYRTQNASFTYFKILFNVNSEQVEALSSAFNQSPDFTVKLENYFSTNAVNETVFDKIEWSLMVVHTDTIMSATLTDEKDETKNSSIKNVDFEIYALSQKALLAYTRTVNTLYENKNLKQIVEDVVKHAPDAELKLEHQFTNNKIIDQCLIPPMNIVRALEFLDFNYGFYSGTHQVWFDDDNKKCKIHIFDPKKYINKAAVKIMGAQHGKVGNKMQKLLKKSIESVGNETNIVINENDLSIYRNTLGFNLSQPYIYHFIEKPLDDLFKDYTINLEGENGLVNKACFIDSRYAYHLPTQYRNKWGFIINHTGFKDTTNVYHEWFAKNYEKMSGLIFSLEGFTDMTNLIPGHTIEYIPVSKNLLSLKGYYKITSVLIEIGRYNSEQWRQYTTLGVTRANSRYIDVSVEETIQWISNFVNNYLSTFSDIFG